MSNKDNLNNSNNLSSTPMQNPEIKANLLTIFDKVAKPSTKDVGYELFTKLVLMNVYSAQQMNYLINQIGKYLIPINNKEKDAFMKLLSLVFYYPQEEEENEDKNVYYQYLSPVLSILQS